MTDDEVRARKRWLVKRTVHRSERRGIQTD
jgi:hypothetical protein